VEGVRVRLDVGWIKEQRLLWLTRHAGRTLAARTRRGVQCAEEGPPRRRASSRRDDARGRILVVAGGASSREYMACHSPTGVRHTPLADMNKQLD
jgi:hypothetical protein